MTGYKHIVNFCITQTPNGKLSRSFSSYSSFERIDPSSRQASIVLQTSQISGAVQQTPSKFHVCPAESFIFSNTYGPSQQSFYTFLSHNRLAFPCLSGYRAKLRLFCSRIPPANFARSAIWNAVIDGPFSSKTWHTPLATNCITSSTPFRHTP